MKPSWQKLKPSPAMAVALLALFLAIGGVGYAASVAKKNSVVSKSIKNGSIRGKDVRDDGLTGADILESSLEGFGERGPAGPQGPKGDQGPSGVTGPAGGDLTGTFDNLQLADGSVVGGPGGVVSDNSITGDDVDEQTLDGLVTSDDGTGSVRTYTSGRVIQEAPDMGSTPSETLIDTGSFSLGVICLDSGSNSIGIQVFLIATQPGSVYTEFGNDGGATLSSSGGNSTIASLISGGNSGASKFYSSAFQAIAPDGTTLQGTAFAATRSQGSDCVTSVMATERTG